MDYCTSNPFSQEGAGSDRCRQDDGENTLYQKLSCRNILVDKEEQSIPCTPRKAQACKKKTPVTVITSVKHSTVSILKTLEHPNIINLAEVIDDQKTDYMYMVLEYVESSCTSNVSETKRQLMKQLQENISRM